MTTINLHPRRAARQCVLEALFAYQFSKNDRMEIIDQLVNENPELNDNYDFIKLLFNCVFTKMQWAEGIIKYHLENWWANKASKTHCLAALLGCKLIVVTSKHHIFFR